jgi:lysyl-tRNA synthetase class 2
MDRTHNPEFTAMEIYVAYKDYNWMMNFAEDFRLRYCCKWNFEATFERIKSTSKHLMLVLTMTDSFYQTFYWFWYL